MPIDTYPAPVQSTPGAVLGYAELSGVSQGSITAETDLTGLAVTINVPAGRRIRITAFANFYSDTADRGGNIFIYEGATRLVAAPAWGVTAGWGINLQATTILTPSAGTHAYKVRVQHLGTGNGTVYSTTEGPSYILVEDITGGTAGPGPIQLGYAEVTANQGSITTIADFTNLAVTVTVPAGRRIKIKGQCIFQSTVIDDVAELEIREGATILQVADVTLRPANSSVSAACEVILTPGAGTHTYKLSGLRAAGSGTVTMIAGALFPAFISVEDITGTPAPGGLLPSSQTLAYQEITANQTGIVGLRDVTGLTVTVTVPAGRRLRITGHVGQFNRNAGTVTWSELDIWEGGTKLNQSTESNPNTYTGADVTAIISPSAGVHTYKLVTNGDGTYDLIASPTLPAFILVEDVTGGALPVPAASVPVGQLAYAELASSYTIGSAGGAADVPGLSVNVTVPAGRTLRVTGFMHLRSTVATDVLYSRINIDGVDYNFAYINELATNPNTPMVQAVVSLAAGAHTIKLRGARQSGTGSLSVYTSPPLEPSFILVEDITPTPAPATTAPSSTLGYAEVISPGATVSSSVAVDQVGLSVTVTVPAGRRLRVSAQALIQRSVPDGTSSLSIMEGAAYLNTAQVQNNVANDGVMAVAAAIVSPSAGTHTYKLTLARPTGTGTTNVYADANNHAFILVEDISSVATSDLAVPGALVVTSATRPGSPLAGTTIFETDTGKLWMWDGGAWTLPRNIAGGILVAPQTNFTGSGAEALSKGTTEDVRYTTTAIQTFANRRYRIRGLLTATSGGSFNYAIVSIRRGTTVGGTLLSSIYYARPSVGRQAMWAEAYDVPGAQASQQWVLTHSIDTSVCDLYAPSGIMVEDVGAA